MRVSRASADQRAGRAGRTQPGVAIRLWRAEQTAALPAFTPPEILEADLSGLLLDCAAFGVADPATLAFLDPPPRAGAQRSAGAAARRSTRSTRRAGSPTSGRAMRRLALPVRLAHMVCRSGEVRPGARRRPCWPCCSPSAGLAATAPISNGGCRGFAANDRRAPMQRASWRSGWRAGWLGRSRSERAQAPASPITASATPAPAHPCLARSRRHGARRARPFRACQWPRRDGSTPPIRWPARACWSSPICRARRRTRASLRRRRSRRSDIRAALGDASRAAVKRVRPREGVRCACAKPSGSAPSCCRSACCRRRPARTRIARILDALREHGLSLLPWSKEAETLRHRLDWLHRGLGAPWPDVSDAALLASLDDWLLPFLSGAASFARIDRGRACMPG